MTSYVVGGGCFWCLDAVYRQLRGVVKAESGYSGGTGEPSYYKVATGRTDHAEVVRITFNETIIPGDIILDIFFLIHNPTTLNRQGADAGTQYRSVLFFADQQQQNQFQKAVKHAQKVWDEPIVTQIVPLEAFYIAEEEHQNYFRKNPQSGYCSIVIEPKVIKARTAYTTWFKEE